MPQVGAWLVSVWTGGGFASAALKAAASLALNFAVAKLTAPKGPRPQDIQTELRQSNAPRIRHLGRVRASGSVMFWDWSATNVTIGGATVDYGRGLFKLLAVGQGGLTAVEQVWLNDVKVDLDANGQCITEPWNGEAHVLFRTGRGAQLAGGAFPQLTEAFPSSWLATHRLDGVGCLLGLFESVGGEDIGKMYAGGEPQITALVKGDACFDPASSTYAWTDNPVLQLVDVLTHPDYGALSASDIDFPSVGAAYADCNELIPLAAGGTIKRYIAGGSYQLSEPLKDVAQRVLDSFAGRTYITTEGKIGVRSGKWRAPTYTITEDKIVAIDIGPGSGEFERVTTLIPRYVAPEVDWQETTATPWDDTAAIALYGESVPQELDLPWVQHHGQARRLAKIQMAKMNPAWRATITLRFWGLLLLEEENVLVNLPSLGLNNAPAWIDSFAFDMNNEEGICTVDLIAADPTSFDWDAVSEEGQPPSQPNAVPHPFLTVANPVITDLQVVTGDGAPYITVEVDTPPVSGVYLWPRYYREPDGPKFDMFFGLDATGNRVWRTSGLQDRGQYTVELTWVNVRPGSSTFDPNDSYVIGSGTTVSSGIEVFENSTPPDPPVVISESGSAGGAFEVTFEPDLGVNYQKTELWRDVVGGSFANATFIKQTFATSQEVTMGDTVPVAGADYWIISANASGVKSAEVFVGSYT